MKKSARRKARRKLPDKTWMIEPPAAVVTPAIARRWLHRMYPELSELAAMCAYPKMVRGLGRREENERAAAGLRGLALDLRRITEVCGNVVATGRPATMRLDFDRSVYRKGVAQKLRAALRYEERYPRPRARAVLRRALRIWEREIRRARANRA